MINVNISSDDGAREIPIAKPHVQLIGYTRLVEQPISNPIDGEVYAPSTKAPPAEAVPEFAYRASQGWWGAEFARASHPHHLWDEGLNFDRYTDLRHAHAVLYVTGASQDFLDFLHQYTALAVTVESFEDYGSGHTFIQRAVLPPPLRDRPALRDKQGNYRRNEFSEMLRLAENTARRIIQVLRSGSSKDPHDQAQARLFDALSQASAVSATSLLPRLTERRMTISGNLLQLAGFIESCRDANIAREPRAIGELARQALVEVAPHVFAADAPALHRWRWHDPDIED